MPVRNISDGYWQLCLALVLLEGVALRGAQASETIAWHGSDETRIDYYNINGDPSASSWPHEGWFASNHLNLSMVCQNTPGQRIEADIDAVAAKDPYLSHDGLILGTAHLRVENGNVSLPYRVDAGDLVANLSRRTLQASVRGAAVEFQPRSDNGAQQSILLVSGIAKPRWSDTFSSNAGDTVHTGMSWLYSPSGGQTLIGANFVHSRVRDGVYGTTPGADLQQTIAGFNAETHLGSLLLEGEIANLSGSVSGSHVHGVALYAQASQAASALSWRLRAERTGAGFAPVGGVGLITDRSSIEGQARYTTGGGGSILGRLQRFIDGRERGMELTTNTAALSWTGLPLNQHPQLSLQVGGLYQDIQAADRSTDRLYRNAYLGVSDRFPRGWRGSWRFDLRDDQQYVAGSVDTRSIDQSVTLNRAFVAGVLGTSVQFDAGAGLILRHQWQNAGSTTTSPLLRLTAHWAHQQLEFYWSFLKQDYTALTTSDLSNQTRRLSWSWEHGPHRFSLELNDDLRSPATAMHTETQRLSLRYRYQFGDDR